MHSRYDFIVELVKEAGERVLAAQAKHVDVRIKGNDPRDLITNVDLEVNKFITDKILASFPNETVYSEEAAEVNVSTGTFWSVDPIDGTANFSKSIPHYAVVISYVEQGVPLTGAVYNPVTRELFSFEKGKGAFLNGRPIQVSPVTSLAEAGVIMNSGRKPELWDWAKRHYTFLLGRVHKLRFFSCSSLDVCFVAAGRMEACIYSHLTTIDVVAALGILKEAGGIWEGRSGPLDQLSKEPQTIYAVNNREILAAVKQED